MIHRKRVIINSNLPGGWETAPPYGERVVINRQKQGWKGDKRRAERGDLDEQVAKVNVSEDIFEASSSRTCQRRQGKNRAGSKKDKG